MSTVGVTDLVAGAAATSSDVNATISSWNSATAAGQVAAGNVRVEGIDRRTLSGTAHVVWTGETGTNSIVQSSTSVGATNSPGAWAVVPFTDGNLMTNDVTIAANHRVIVHATLHVTNSASAAPAMQLLLRLERSTNGGGAWTAVSGTYRNHYYKNVYSVAPDLVTVASPIPGIVRSVTWAIDDSPAAGVATRWRVVFQTLNPGSVNFRNGGIWTEVIGA